MYEKTFLLSSRALFEYMLMSCPGKRLEVKSEHKIFFSLLMLSLVLLVNEFCIYIIGISKFANYFQKNVVEVCKRLSSNRVLNITN